MGIVLLLLYPVILFKLIAIFNASRWVIGYGPDYREMPIPPVKDYRQRDRILDDCYAGFFPFGLKDYKLDSLIRDKRGSDGLQKVAGLALWVAGKGLFQFQGLAFVSSVLLFATAGISPEVTIVGYAFYGWLG